MDVNNMALDVVLPIEVQRALREIAQLELGLQRNDPTFQLTYEELEERCQTISRGPETEVEKYNLQRALVDSRLQALRGMVMINTGALFHQYTTHTALDTETSALESQRANPLARVPVETLAVPTSVHNLEHEVTCLCKQTTTHDTVTCSNARCRKIWKRCPCLSIGFLPEDNWRCPACLR